MIASIANQEHTIFLSMIHSVFAKYLVGDSVTVPHKPQLFFRYVINNKILVHSFCLTPVILETQEAALRKIAV
jgi:hypothetical protein